jgi:hypothetical protein
MVRRFAFSENNFGKALSKGSVVVHAGISEVFIGKAF